MGFWELVFFLILFVPVVLFILTVYILSAVGKTLGFRRKYIRFLLWIFEYGRKRIERARRKKGEEEEEDEVDDGISTASESEYPELLTPSQRKRLGLMAGEPMNNGDNGTASAEEEENTIERDFELSEIFDFVNTGIEAIVQDQVTQRFASEELKSWNLLTRTNRVHEFISWRLSFLWLVGFLIRYGILLPFRVTICFLAVVFLTMSTSLVGCIPDYYFTLKRRLYAVVYRNAFEFLSWSLSAVITYHDLKNRPGACTWIVNGKPIPPGSGICVANHTSPIDVLMLAVDQCYDMVGQRHGGFLGLLQRALARASSHIWFERSEMKDREAVARRLREHVEDTDNLPILIFPEGTCINNSAVMQFKKGSFEVGSIIYPVAIKYDARFGDPFWDSSRYGMVQYLLNMMSSWAIVCDVWYLPAMYRKSGESAVEFANRVKSAIARKGGLVDLDWDGQLKRAFAKKEWKEQQQFMYAKKFASPKRQLPKILGEGDTHYRNPQGNNEEETFSNFQPSEIDNT